ncbi:hypothetical protein DRP07_05045 [Archaeoglobales archaeon]|nr:MAG: hypothetical protein DRP07_05045 [Archaeoglobales archaeon]
MKGERVKSKFRGVAKITLLSLFLMLLIQISSASPLSLTYKTIPANPSIGEFVLQLYVTNLGNDVTTVELFISEKEEGLAIIERGKEVSYVYLNLGGVPQGTASAELKLRAEKSGFYELSVNLRANGSESIRNVIVLKVSDKPSFSAIGSVEIEPSSRKECSIKIKNNGGKARDVKVYLKTPEGIVSNTSKFYFKEWSTGEERILNFTLTTDGSLEIGVYEIPIEVGYTDDFGNIATDTITVSMNVIGRPEIVISVDKTTPERIYPDMDFTLNLAVENTGFDEAKNVRVELGIPEGFQGETEKLLGTLKKKEMKTVSFTLKSGNKTGVFPFEVQVFYEHDEEKRVLENFNVFVSERGKISLDIAGVFTSPQILTAGTRFKLSLQLENSGKQDAKAVSINLILPEGISGKKSYFIGTLESGDSATASFDLIANEAGEKRIEAVISYMDQKFDRYEVEKEFSLYVFEQGGGEIYLFAAIVVVGIALLVTIKKIRGRRK